MVTEEVMQFPYKGSGTEDHPYAVVWIPADPRNPMNFPPIRKWSITLLVSFVTLAVSLVSSAFSGGMRQIMEDFGAAQEIVILGVSLFVLGFAIGPLIWAPLSVRCSAGDISLPSRLCRVQCRRGGRKEY